MPLAKVDKITQQFAESPKIIDLSLESIVAIDCVKKFEIMSCRPVKGRTCSHYVQLIFNDGTCKVKEFDSGQIVMLLNHKRIEDPHFKSKGNFKENFPPENLDPEKNIQEESTQDEEIAESASFLYRVWTFLNDFCRVKTKED